MYFYCEWIDDDKFEIRVTDKLLIHCHVVRRWRVISLHELCLVE